MLGREFNLFNEELGRNNQKVNHSPVLKALRTLVLENPLMKFLIHNLKHREGEKSDTPAHLEDRNVIIFLDRVDMFLMLSFITWVLWVLYCRFYLSQIHIYPLIGEYALDENCIHYHPFMLPYGCYLAATLMKGTLRKINAFLNLAQIQFALVLVTFCHVTEGILWMGSIYPRPPLGMISLVMIDGFFIIRYKVDATVLGTFLSFAAFICYNTLKDDAVYKFENAVVFIFLFCALDYIAFFAYKLALIVRGLIKGETFDQSLDRIKKILESGKVRSFSLFHSGFFS
jgi:hypothetical protein